MNRKLTSNSFLSRLYPPKVLKKVLLAQTDWRPYPRASQRDAWQVIPANLRQQYIQECQALLAAPWPRLPASLYLEYSRTGNRSHFEEPYFLRRKLLSLACLAECLEGQGRFTEFVANAAWSICEELSWCIPAHVGDQKAGVNLPDTGEPIVDLFAAETAATLAWVDYLLGDQLAGVSALIRPRIEREIQARLLRPALERSDFWWMGFGKRRVNNWNPWINSNWLTCVLLIEKDDSARLQAIKKILYSLDRFLLPYPKDGGCDEGPSYWGHAGGSLFDCLELLYSACQGQVNPFQEALVQEIGRYIYRVHISGDYFVNFADASARVVPSPAVVYGYGKRIGDAELLAFGAWLADRAGLYASINQVEGYSRGLGRLLAALFLYPELSAVQAQAPLKRDVWLDQIQVMAARDEGYSPSGFYVAAKGGHNDESHNHNDIGHFIVYFDGKPLLVDAGVETYTRKTFSPQRYEIWTMQSAYHALPTIDGIMQSPGRNFAASQVRYQADDQQVEFFLNLAGAYPSEAHLEAYLRRILFQRRAWLEVQDSFSLNAPAGELAMSLLTPCGIDLNAPNLVKLCARSLPANLETATGQIEYSIEGSDPQAARLTVSAERIPIEDSRLAPIWGDHLNRLVFRWTNPPLRGAWRLIVKA